MTRLILVRHGRSAYAHSGGWLDRAGVFGWRAAYDAAGIADGDAPPMHLITIAAKAERLIASDLPRARDSAARLSSRHTIEVSSLLRETPLPVPQLSLRLPLGVWQTIIHLRWGLHIAIGRPAEPSELTRADEAASWLTDNLNSANTAIVVTHGVFRSLLSRRLPAHGWRSETRRRRFYPWSDWAFVR